MTLPEDWEEETLEPVLWIADGTCTADPEFFSVSDIPTVPHDLSCLWPEGIYNLCIAQLDIPI